MLAFAGIGIGYAVYWSEALTVNGSVVTGELDAGFSECSCTDSDDGLGYTGEGLVSCELKDDDNDGDNELAVITINNAYPGYEATCTLTIMNTGTIPLHVKSVNINNPNSDELNVDITNDPTCTTLDVGETATLGLKVTVTDSAAENGQYSFTVTVDIEQFNAPQ